MEQDKKINIEEETEDDAALQEGDIITLLDADDNEVEFEFLDAIESCGKQYIVVAPVEESDDEDGEVVILKVSKDDEGNEVYIDVEDDEAQRVFDIFVSDEDDYDIGDAE